MRETLAVLSGAAASLGLAVIPVAAAYAAALVASRTEGWVRRASWCLLIPLGAVWLVTLPGATLLTVSWWHTAQQLLRSGPAAARPVPGGLEGVLSFALRGMACALYGGFGLVAFTLAIRPVHQLMRRWTPDPWVGGAPLFLYASVGVCVRLMHPSHHGVLAIQSQALIAATLDILSRPALLPGVVALAIFLWLVYAAVDTWVDAILARWANVP